MHVTVDSSAVHHYGKQSANVETAEMSQQDHFAHFTPLHIVQFGLGYSSSLKNYRVGKFKFFTFQSARVMVSIMLVLNYARIMVS